jgi:hypothetical protein
MTVAEATTAELFTTYGAVLAELRARGVVRTNNAPAGDYAEYLVAAGLGGTLVPPSVKSHDVRLSDGTLVQVKARVISDPPVGGWRQLSAIRSWDFDWLVVVFLSSVDYHVVRAVQIPKAAAQAVAKWRAIDNANLLHATEDLLGRGIDVTEAVAAGGQKQLASGQ